MRSTLLTLQPSKALIRPRHLLALGALLAPLALAAPPARADRCDYGSRGDLVIRTSRSYDRGHSRSYGRATTRGSDHTYGRTYGRSYTDRGHTSGYVGAPSGYYKQVYRPAVYRTQYDECGRARRVCVQSARYERVWVSTGSRHYRSRW